MKRQDVVSHLSALVLLLAIAAISFGVEACGASGRQTSSAGCRVGAAVGAPRSGDALPPCSTHEPRNSAYNYPCRGSSASTKDFYLVYLSKSVLYGKPGGTWHRAPENAAFSALRNKLGC
jgi:hypothetical protein